MAHFGVYTYPYNNEVSLGNFNMPFSQQKLTLYRGANNPLSFTVHNADGKYTLLRDDEYLVFTIFDARSDTVIYDTVLNVTLPSWVSEAGQARPTISNKKKIYYTCVVPAGVLQDLSTGSKYRWSVRKVQESTEPYEPTSFLYTGLNYEASAELIISNQAAPVFVPSKEISSRINSGYISVSNPEFFDISEGYDTEHDVLVSSPISFNVEGIFNDGLSTCTLYFDNFIGRVQLQGTLSNESPSADEDYKWFNLEIGDLPYIGEQDQVLNGIKYYNFEGKLMWVRVMVCIPPEIIEVDPVVKKKVYNPLSTLPKVLIRR